MAVSILGNPTPEDAHRSAMVCLELIKRFSDENWSSLQALGLICGLTRDLVADTSSNLRDDERMAVGLWFKDALIRSVDEGVMDGEASLVLTGEIPNG